MRSSSALASQSPKRPERSHGERSIWEYQVGQWEGIVLAHHPDPVVAYTAITGNGARFDGKHS